MWVFLKSSLGNHFRFSSLYLHHHLLCIWFRFFTKISILSFSWQCSYYFNASLSLSISFVAATSIISLFFYCMRMQQQQHHHHHRTLYLCSAFSILLQLITDCFFCSSFASSFFYIFDVFSFARLCLSDQLIYWKHSVESEMSANHELSKA